MKSNFYKRVKSERRILLCYYLVSKMWSSVLYFSQNWPIFLLVAWIYPQPSENILLCTLTFDGGPILSGAGESKPQEKIWSLKCTMLEQWSTEGSNQTGRSGPLRNYFLKIINIIPKGCHPFKKCGSNMSFFQKPLTPPPHFFQWVLFQFF